MGSNPFFGMAAAAIPMQRVVPKLYHKRGKWEKGERGKGGK